MKTLEDLISKAKSFNKEYIEILKKQTSELKAELNMIKLALHNKENKDIITPFNKDINPFGEYISISKKQYNEMVYNLIKLSTQNRKLKKKNKKLKKKLKKKHK